MIAFNVLFIAVLACLFRPRLLSQITGGEPLSRWWFAIAMMALTAVSPYGPRGSHSTTPGNARTQSPARLATPVAEPVAAAAPAAAVRTEEAAAIR
ncbi:hypothetical protein D8I35_01110 [Corticibacter populi]|uniref:Uncharacterized protein n=1 Tax=Corticibacter populi TaxID=1550736 RepID=A0A3M6QXL5_9BURK|nr:hypothetical protein [Corticibacter populi]RMX07766.1 hypothetical protein D8I35_01110 [Corticibacter populi]